MFSNPSWILWAGGWGFSFAYPEYTVIGFQMNLTVGAGGSSTDFQAMDSITLNVAPFCDNTSMTTSATYLNVRSI